MIAEDGKDLRLYAFEGRTGTLISERKLGRSRPATLAAWGNRVIVVQDGTVSGVPLKDGAFGMPWRKKGDYSGAPCVWNGRLLIRGKKGLNLMDATTGRVMTTGDGPSPASKAVVTNIGSVAIRVVNDTPVASWVTHTNYKDPGTDDVVVLSTLGVLDAESRKPKLKGVRGAGGFKTLKPKQSLDVDRAPLATLAWLGGDNSGDKGVMLMISADCGAWSGSIGLNPKGGQLGPQMTGQPSLMDGTLYGFAKSGELRAMNLESGKVRPLASVDKLPKGARPGPSCSWSDAVCFGNWAMDMSTGRTLWVLPDLPEIVATVPITDGFLMLATKTNERIGLAEPGRAVPAAAVTGADGPAVRTAGSEAAPPAPAPGDGILMKDGRKVLGTAEASDDTVTITPTEGEPFDVPRDQVAAVEEGGEIVLRGEEPAVLGAWQTVLDGMVVRTLAEQIDIYRKEKLIKASRRLLDQMRTFNIGSAYADELQKSLSGQRENPNADLKMKRLGLEEEKRRDLLEKAVNAAIDWCEENDYPGAATALLDHAGRLGVSDDDVLARAKELMPDEFPWKDDKTAAKQWLTWALEIVPAGGAFLDEDHSLRNRAGNEPWYEDTILLRTENLLLFSRAHDPGVVGMCLRTGEGTVRALHALLGESATGGSGLLDIRLHANRKEYLAEETRGEKAPVWSAGYYSPGLSASRFYVSGPGDAESTRGNLGRELKSTLSHEITHHWLSERWMSAGSSRRGSAVPGYWIVEGFARFIEDQSQEMSRRRGRLDDETAPSLDSASQVARVDKLMDTAELVGMNQFEFGQIKEKPVATITLRNTMQSRVVDVRGLFYEQSGGLVFFLMNKCGEDTREAMINYMRQHYEGRSPSEPFSNLGFEDGKDFHAKYEAYLKSLAE